MAYFPPKGNIYILRFVPLDNTYTNTIYFDNREEQIQYFTAKSKLQFTEQTYTRIEQGIIRIEQNAENLYDCNYLMYQNPDFGEQWFYCFITSIEYLNNYTSEIHFEIDVIQTWYWNYGLGQCYVEREHSLTDEIGDSLTTENINFGDYLPRSTSGIPNIFDEYGIVINSSETYTGDTSAQYVTGLPQCTTFYSIGPINANNSDERMNEFKAILDGFIEENKVDQIINIVFMPWELFNAGKDVYTYNHQFYRPTTINGYIPKNKKLFTYPYNFISVSNGKSVCNYRYEYFQDPENIQFRLTATTNVAPQVALTPFNYKNMMLNYNEEILMSDFPQVAYAIDTFKQWVVENGLNTALSLIGQGTAFVGGVMASPSTGGLSLFAAAAGAAGAAQTINGIVIDSTRANQGRGTAATDIDVARRSKNFYFSEMQITAHYAKIVDDYFTMFGYSVNEIKIPNIGTRPYFNYVKLGMCNFNWYEQPKGTSVPQKYMQQIISIYQKGITFWKSSARVGDYSVDNSPS